MNQIKISKVTGKNATENEKISFLLPDKSDSVSKGKVPIVSFDKNLKNIDVEQIGSVKGPGLYYSRKKLMKECLTPVKINVSEQNECQYIKTVSNSSKLFSKEKLSNASEKIPKVSPKIIYVGEASQIPVLKQAMGMSTSTPKSSAKLIHDNVLNVNKEHALQMKHLSVEKVLNGKESVQMNPAKVAGTQKMIVNLPKDGCFLETKGNPNLINFSESGSVVQNKQSKNIVGNKKLIVLPVNSISEVTSPIVQLSPFQNPQTKLHLIPSFNTVENVSLKSNSPVRTWSPKQVRTSHELINTQPIKLIMNESSMSSFFYNSSSEESRSSSPCSVSSVKKDIICSRKNIKEEHNYPLVNLRVMHMEPKSCVISPLKKNQATCIKSDVEKASNISLKRIPANATSINWKKISAESKNDSHKIVNKSSTSKINSSIKKRILPTEASLAEQDKNNSYKTRNKNSTIEVASCAAVKTSVPNTISSPNMNEINYIKNNRYETRSKKIFNFTEHKNQFIGNKVTDFIARPKNILTIVQPRVILKRLPDAINKECVKKGYIHIKKLTKMSVLASEKKML